MNGTHQLYDTIIVGGGAAGIGAAVGAKQAAPDSRVLIIETEGFLGGAATHRGVLSYCGLYSVETEPRRAVGEIWTEIHRRLVRAESATELPNVITGYVQNVEPEGLKCVLDDLVLSIGVDTLLHCTVVGGSREGTKITSIEVQERRGRRHIYGKAFVDCSGDGDLGFHAHASTRYGNHGHVNLGSLSTRFGGLDGANPTYTLWRDAVLAAKAADPELKKLIPRNVGVLIKLPQSGHIATYMASASRQAQIYLDIWRKLPGHENMYLVSTGPNFGTRESRHLNARYQLTESDIMEARTFDDTVAVGAWYMEWHDASQADWPIRFRVPPSGTFNIPLRCLHSVDTENLFCAGRCVDGDQAASSAIRVMGTALATGQAAGTAASLTAGRGATPSARDVQDVLVRSGALLDRNNLPRAPFVQEPEGRNISHKQAMQGG